MPKKSRQLKWRVGTRMRVLGLGAKWLLAAEQTDAKGMVKLARMRQVNDDMFREYYLWVERDQVRKAG